MYVGVIQNDSRIWARALCYASNRKLQGLRGDLQMDNCIGLKKREVVAK